MFVLYYKFTRLHLKNIFSQQYHVKYGSDLVSRVSVRSAGFPHDQRCSQGYLPRRILPFKLFQH